MLLLWDFGLAINKIRCFEIVVWISSYQYDVISNDIGVCKTSNTWQIVYEIFPRGLEFNRLIGSTETSCHIPESQRNAIVLGTMYLMNGADSYSISNYIAMRNRQEYIYILQPYLFSDIREILYFIQGMINFLLILKYLNILYYYLLTFTNLF